LLADQHGVFWSGTLGDRIGWVRTDVAIQRIAGQVVAEEGHPGVFNLCVGDAEETGERMAGDVRLPLISWPRKLLRRSCT
jgi:hypothetical protein